MNHCALGSTEVGNCGPSGNKEHPHGKPFFHLTKVLLNRDRYCSYCGKQVKEEWKFCRDPKCQRSTTPE
ncbi:unnamed protein product [Allacma fusca]|uniref:Uncharacterized protein n=1 Tax=Allacma fusca TaxID=39272 RepID=A0A8J2L7Z4_9HEXA|nr:unnamed protein product [Allacma fusca]